jgi:hypothetical protein
MSIALVTTRGFGNGTLAGSIASVILRGYLSAEAITWTTIVPVTAESWSTIVPPTAEAWTEITTNTTDETWTTIVL